MADSTGVDRNTGQILTDFDHVVQSLQVIFTTRITERLMRRLFGSFVPGLLGKNLVGSTVTRFYFAVVIAVELWEPRFRVTQMLFPGATNGASKARAGKLGIRLVGQYRPRALQGDFTVASIQTVTL